MPSKNEISDVPRKENESCTSTNSSTTSTLEKTPLPASSSIIMRRQPDEEEIVVHDINYGAVDESSATINNDHDDTSPAPNNNTATTSTTSILVILGSALWLFLPTLVYLALFTKMGWGLSTYSILTTTTSALFLPELILLAALTLGLYWCDVVYWQSCGWQVSWGMVWLLLTTAFSLTLLEALPFAPLALLIAIWIPLWMILFFRILLPKTTNNDTTSIRPTFIPFCIVAIVTFLSWFVWTFLSDDNEFNSHVALNDAVESGLCSPKIIDFEEYPECQVAPDGTICYSFADATEYNANSTNSTTTSCPEYCLEILYEHCYTPFFIWSGPLLLSLGLLSLGCWIHVLFKQQQDASTTTTDCSSDSSTTILKKKSSINIWFSFWAFVLFGLWVSASLWGLGTGVSTTLLVLTVSCLVAILLLLWLLPLSNNDNNKANETETIWNRLGLNSIESYYTSTAMRGLLVLTCLPLVVIYLALQLVRQMIRSLTKGWFVPSSDHVDIHNTSSCWTTEALAVIKELQSWQPRTAILVTAMYWSLAFFFLTVFGAQLTIVLLSHLLKTLTASEMSLATITLLLCVIGLGMFLLPPVPGVPIYMTLGMVLIPVGQSQCGWSPLVCILYGIGVSLFLKLVACAVQQKCIGQGLQSSIAIRQLCQVNSDAMRSMKLVLAGQPELFRWNKIFILVGGPDWPTSVLCGIMDLPLLPILIGTLPVIALITPTLLTGSFTYLASVYVMDGKNNEQPLYPQAQTWATICAALTAMVLLGSMVLAASALASTLSLENKTKLDELVPLDLEVLEADQRAQARQDLYASCTEWQSSSLPRVMKVVLIVALTGWIVSFHLLMYFDNLCFVEYQLSYSIETHLDGNVWNFILPLGWVAMGLAFMSVVLQFGVFRLWANAEVNKKQLLQQDTETNHDPSAVITTEA